ncbi:LmeA family phospholipid-binding protein [Kitasatospora sp. NPDC054939]
MRGWQKATIGVVAVGGLLVGADRIAVGVAEGEAADRLVKSGRMSERPDVSIEGFPFLTQALSMKLDDVRISSNGLTVGNGTRQVALQSFTAKLSGVSVSDSFSSATVDKGSGSGLIGYADLSQLMPPASRLLSGGRLPVGGGTRPTLSYAGPGKIKAALGPLEIGEGTLKSQGNTVTVEGFQLSGMAAVVAGATNQKIEPMSFTLSSLPAGLSLSGVAPQQDGLKLSFEGTKVDLIG